MTTTTGDALYAACLANPDDDTPRLILADYLDGLDSVRVACSQCNGSGGWITGPHSEGCLRCDGAGTITDASNAQRAELIRVQCRVEAFPACPRPGCGLKYHLGQCEVCQKEMKRLLARERELKDIAKAQWERLPCPRCDGSRWIKDTVNPIWTVGQRMHCPLCGHSGDLLQELRWVDRSQDRRQEIHPRTVHWLRGFPVVECTSAKVWLERETVQHGTWEPGLPRLLPTPWARAVAGWASGFRLTDWFPGEYIMGPKYWHWETAGRSQFPSGVKELLAGRRSPTHEAAVAALDTAAAQWVRSFNEVEA